VAYCTCWLFHSHPGTILGVEDQQRWYSYVFCSGSVLRSWSPVASNNTLYPEMAIYTCKRWTIFFLFASSLLTLTSCTQQTGGFWANSTASSISPPSSTSSSTWASSATDSLEHHSSPNVGTTSSDVGDFIAAGMGMIRSTVAATTETMSTNTLSTVDQERSITTSSTTTIMTGTTSPIKGNYTISFTGDCWEQWGSYWTAVSSASHAQSWVSSAYTSTITGIRWDFSQSWERIPTTMTTTVMNGAFAQTTFVTVTETTILAQFTEFSIGEYTQTNIGYKMERSDLFHGIIIRPTCILPDYVPACQTSWENWVSGKHQVLPTMAEHSCMRHADKKLDLQPLSCQAQISSYNSVYATIDPRFYLEGPTCAQARVTGALCSSLVDNLVRTAKSFDHLADGIVVLPQGLTEYTTTQSSKVMTLHSEVLFWNASSSVAPGCSLGCHSCQINGGTVQLIYWPPASSTWIEGTYSAISGSNNKTLTVVTLETTLTSPTVYISFDSLYARDSCSAFGRTYSNEIVAITETARLSSLYGWNRDNGLGVTASFNFTDL